MNKDLKKGSGVKSEISPADGKPPVVRSAYYQHKIIVTFGLLQRCFDFVQISDVLRFMTGDHTCLIVVFTDFEDLKIFGV